MAAVAQGVDGFLRQSAFGLYRGRLERARIETRGQVIGVEVGRVDRRLQVHTVMDVT